MPIHIPPLSLNEIARAAEKCLAERHQEGTIPVPIEDIIDVGFGIDLVPTPGLEERFQTIAFITHDLREIRIDGYVFNKQSNRLRFSLAHELGHLVLHQGIYRQMAFQSPAQWKQAMSDLGQANYNRLESQADRFAGFLLVPTTPFQSEFGKVTEALSQAGKNFNSLPDEAQDYAVRGLGRVFGVASGAIWHRLHDEKLI